MANILLDVGHPAHVHLFRNAALQWKSQGHNILFTALDREMILRLLDNYNLPYVVTYRRRKGKLALVLELIVRTLTTLRIALRFKPDLFVSFGSPTVGFPAFLLRKPYLALTDTDDAPEQHILFKPFATVIATPEVFRVDLGPKQIRYASYHELAYLHPDVFTPDPNTRETLGAGPDEKVFLVRFVAWDATHDIGEHGLSHKEKIELLSTLAKHGHVFVSVEADRPDPEFARYASTFPPERIHDLLSIATMYVGEGGTIITEANVLGVPAVFISTRRAGNWIELQDTYHMLFMADTGREGINRVQELLAMPDLKQVWTQRRAALLADKISLTPWLVDLGNRLIKTGGKRLSD